uniref:Cocaine- and amphetamine-regulated transcript protein n=1 Tax=Seriola dumerili TaxID=41447 RepID=A0A3B4VDK7_SERDU
MVSCEELTEERSLDDVIKTQEEKELIEALQDILEKLQSKQLPSSEKKLGRLPLMHDAGKHCVLRKGLRVGKMCVPQKASVTSASSNVCREETQTQVPTK